MHSHGEGVGWVDRKTSGHAIYGRLVSAAGEIEVGIGAAGVREERTIQGQLVSQAKRISIAGGVRFRRGVVREDLGVYGMVRIVMVGTVKQEPFDVVGCLGTERTV